MARRWTPQRFVKLRRLRVAASAIVVLAVSLGMFMFTARKTVAITVNGETTTVTTYAMSASRLLESQGIDVKTHDIVESSAGGEKLTNHSVVTVQSAYQTTISIDGQEVPFWTTATSAAQLLGFFEANEHAAAKVTVNIDNIYSKLTGGLVINADGPVTVIADGKSSVAPNGKLPAASILDSKGITLGKEDRVSVEKDGGRTILRVQRVTHGEETRTVAVPHGTQTIEDPSLAAGTTVVRQQGEDGEKRQTYSVTYVDGKKESEKLKSETTTKIAIDTIVAVGTKQPETSKNDDANDASGKTDGQSSGTSGSANADADDKNDATGGTTGGGSSANGSNGTTGGSTSSGGSASGSTDKNNGNSAAGNGSSSNGTSGNAGGGKPNGGTSSGNGAAGNSGNANGGSSSGNANKPGNSGNTGNTGSSDATKPGNSGSTDNNGNSGGSGSNGSGGNSNTNSNANSGSNANGSNSNSSSNSSSSNNGSSGNNSGNSSNGSSDSSDASNARLWRPTAAQAQAYAAGAAAQRGWTGDDWTALVKLWNRESGWSWSAENASSGAYGIPQALPGSKMADFGADWKNDAAVQIDWGLAYIAQRYGTPSKAWEHSEKEGWY